MMRLNKSSILIVLVYSSCLLIFVRNRNQRKGKTRQEKTRKEIRIQIMQQLLKGVMTEDLIVSNDVIFNPLPPPKPKPWESYWEFVKMDVIYRTAPGEIDLHLDLYYPQPDEPTPGKAKFPVVVYTHGGGYRAGSHKGNIRGPGDALRGLVKRGFAVASVEYRLTNKDYRGGGRVVVGDCVTDSKDAVRYLSKYQDELCLDMERVFLFGDSAGGQIAQMLLLSQPNDFPGSEELTGYEYTAIAGVSWYGPCDFENLELFNGSNRFKRRIVKEDMSPAEKLDAIRAVSPINYLTKNSPPLLMIQGDRDTTIPVQHAFYMKEKADELGAPVELNIVKNAGHNFIRVDPEKKVQPPKAEIAGLTVDYLAKFLL